MYLASNLFGFLSVARKIKKTPTLHQPSTDSSGQRSQEGFITENFTFYPPSQWIWTYIPRYIKFFNSFEVQRMRSVRRIKYRFLNEPYLYKLTHWKFYKMDQIQDLRNKCIRWMQIQRYSFDASDHYLNAYVNSVSGLGPGLDIGVR